MKRKALAELVLAATTAQEIDKIILELQKLKKTLSPTEQQILPEQQQKIYNLLKTGARTKTELDALGIPNLLQNLETLRAMGKIFVIYEKSKVTYMVK
jgi:hypothetical protein